MRSPTILVAKAGIRSDGIVWSTTTSSPPSARGVTETAWSTATPARQTFSRKAGSATMADTSSGVAS